MFTAEVSAAAKAHAIRAFPAEACGLVVASSYVPCRNKSAAHDRFEIAPEDYAEALIAGDVQGIIHSHPNGPEHPSKADMAQQIASRLPWAIVATDGENATEPIWWGPGAPRADLEKRFFRFGVTDCYSLIRDWYWEKRGIDLPEFPREWGEWQQGVDGYAENCQSAGFQIVCNGSGIEAGFRPEIGDLAILRLLPDCAPCHGGIYVGEERVFHHLASLHHAVDRSRFPRLDLVGPYRDYVAYWLRYSSDAVSRGHPANPALGGAAKP